MKYNFCWLQARRAHGIDLSNTIILLDEAHNIVRSIFCQIQPDIHFVGSLVCQALKCTK